MNSILDIKIGTLVKCNGLNPAGYIKQILPYGFESFSLLPSIDTSRKTPEHHMYRSQLMAPKIMTRIMQKNTRNSERRKGISSSNCEGVGPCSKNRWNRWKHVNTIIYA
jgi:hypothetical protein